MKPDLIDSFIYKGANIIAEWFDISSKDQIPDLPWQGVYAVCNLGNKIPFVYSSDNISKIPGGRTEHNESLNKTLRREIKEELNCSIVSWIPIGYQKNYRNGKLDSCQLRVYAIIKKNGEFENDPAGTVIGFRLTNLSEFGDIIMWNKIGYHIQHIVEKLFGKVIPS